MVIVARGAGNSAHAAVAMEVAAAAGAETTAAVIHGHTGEMDMKATTATGEIEVAQTIPHGTKEGGAHGTMAPPLHTPVR